LSSVLALGKEFDKYIIVDLEEGQSGETIFTLGGETCDLTEDMLINIAKDIIKIVNEKVEYIDHICATCKNYKIKIDECKIRRKARPTPPAKISNPFVMACTDWERIK